MIRILRIAILLFAAHLPGFLSASDAPDGSAVVSQDLDDPAAAFAEANANYEKARWTRARTGYEDLIEDGLNQPALCYNLGNVHYRLGNRGLAILFYERARRMDPRDEDIRHNLELARTGLEHEGGEVWELLDLAITPAELPWIVSGLFWALCLAAGWALLSGHPWRRWRSTILPLLICFLILSLWLAGRTRDLDAAWSIATEEPVRVRSGPGEQFTVGFTIPAGQRALILNMRPGWTEIGVPSRSLKGWVRAESIERI